MEAAENWLVANSSTLVIIHFSVGRQSLSPSVAKLWLVPSSSTLLIFIVVRGLSRDNR
ncbi:hypothetical protein BVI434_410129 [Burkholderia vietnamiensis]|nr:hypothetical protein BVI434_410129 [Burkholderia vietnamiensis]